MKPEWINILSSLGAGVAAVVSTWWFLFRRALDPGSELELDVAFAGVQSGQMLFEVTALLTNKSSVHQHYANFQLSVRYLLPDDKILDGPEKRFHQLEVPRSINDRIGGQKRQFGDAEYIDAGIRFRHSYITFAPAEASYLWLHVKLEFKTRKHWYSISPVWHRKSMQRLVKVPES